MQKLLHNIWKKCYSFSFAILVCMLLASFLSVKIISNIYKHNQDKRNSILLITRAAEAAVSQGFLPSKSALLSLEQAYHLGGESVKPYAGFLASCFYIHNEPLRGAYYAGLAYNNSQALQLPDPIQALLKEISEAQADQLYDVALSKSYMLLQAAQNSPDYATLSFLTLLRVIELKELLNQDASQDFEILKSLPLFHQFERMYSDGEWTLSKRFGKKG
ncbi:hypothetical protein C10C_0652 [Chlamydia serpentis]|uniref:Uncharacterized protein n=1 Tax=Chlamydia serpentis TaxID=1967782 RepID=A0A2R8FBK0_9CHLA|nr:hypothetical protein [Chlamydia serpentis]SPN73805.1 hypothetical protein C10C_0652 [Chlamydia serpentis]